MENDRVFIRVNEAIMQSEKFEKLKRKMIDFANNKKLPVFILDRPLVGNEEDYIYDYQLGFGVLIPGYKLIFTTTETKYKEEFEEYLEDFSDDLSALSDKYKHKKVIGKKRTWMDLIVERDIDNLSDFSEYVLVGTEKRKSELLVSLITGSINDVERVGIDQPDNTLEAIKKRIVVFDADQTRFIYNTKKSQKQVTIQGLAGTGKTELLLHKLVDLYVKEPTSKIVFTCFNKILANDMLQRIPEFFNFMKVDKQIEWNERLWAMRSWGSQINPNSGIYSFICDQYRLPFSRYTPGISFNQLCSNLLYELNKLEGFEPCFDYVLIDEGQDFDDSFFALCEKVTSKQVIIASDIFQNIFEKDSKITHHPDFTLNKVYRTDPKNFIFAQMIGFGVEETPAINWLSDNTWKTCGYSIEKDQSEKIYTFTREPLIRFDDLSSEKEESPLQLFLEDDDNILESTVEIISKIIKVNVNVHPSDIGIVFLSSGNYMYKLADRLSMRIASEFDWETQKGYEVKNKGGDKLFISNRNNIKGLEFPFVICIATNRIASNPVTRNSLYMALTRSFITSFLVLDSSNEELVSKYRPMYEEIMNTGKATIKKPESVMNDGDRSILKRLSLTQGQIVEQLLIEMDIRDHETVKKIQKSIPILLPSGNADKLKIKETIEMILKVE